MRHTPYADHDRPLCTSADERDREIEIRNRLTAERAQAMEQALPVAGFSDGTVAWSLAVLVAKICTGWEPLVRPLRDLAADSAISTTCKGKDRQRTVKRELDNLQAAGVLTWERHELKRRRGRPIVVCTITLHRRRIVEGDFEPSEPPENGSKVGGQEGGQKGGQEGGQKGGHGPAPSSYPPYTLKNPVPLSPSGTEEEDQKDLEPREGRGQSIEAGAIADRVGALFHSLGYRGQEGSTLWLISAAVELGVLPEHALGDATAAVQAVRPRNPVAYFRRVAADAAGLTMDKLQDELRRVRVLPRLPSGPPRASPRERPKPRKEPSPTSDQSMNDRRNAIHAALQGLDS